MRRPVDVLANAIAAIRDQLVGLTRQSERTLLLGTVLLVSTVSAATGFVLTQYFAKTCSALCSTSPRIAGWTGAQTLVGTASLTMHFR